MFSISYKTILIFAGENSPCFRKSSSIFQLSSLFRKELELQKKLETEKFMAADADPWA
jgi:hypothetical protein